MNGGLIKSASRFALVAAAGILAGGVAAQAADLGGNCCADLEERVAELEATSARKGNRKVRLTVSGQVNESVLYWDDGRERNAYVTSNNFGRTRFRFVGDAKINADWSAGYLLEIGVRYANSGNRSQVSASGSAITSSNGNNSFDIRHSAWWLDSKTYGRLWVGNTSTATDGITEISLANVIAGGNDGSNYLGGFRLRNATGALTNVTHSSIRSGNFNAGEGDRNNVIKYVSPTWAGFTFTGAWGDEEQWDVAIRYAGEFSGFRFAAGVGYQENRSQNTAGAAACANVGGNGNPATTESSVDCNDLGLSASVFHVPTGLFLTGSYGRAQDNNRSNFAVSNPAGGKFRSEDSHWFVQGGIERNWFGIGKSTVFAQYVAASTGAAIGGGARSSAAAGGGFAALGAGGFVSDAGIREFGVGFNQEVSAAALDLYVTYFHVDADVTTSATGGQNGKVRATGNTFDAVVLGAIIRF